ncbi:MAG TPA: hypothetical protein VF403_05720 [Kofleriaceae bacterium]
MSKTSLLVSMIVLGLAGAAHAGGQAGSIGVGAEYQMSGVGGLSVVYDAGLFHVGGMIGFDDPAGANNTVFQLAGEFYYHVHHSAFADFGLGGSLGFNSVPVPPMGMVGNQRNTEVYLEPGFQIRAFLSSNVALSATAGLIIGTVDASRVAITGQNFGASGGVGIHYYFY